MYCHNQCRAWASYWRRRNGEPVPPRWQHPAMISDDPVLHAAAVRARQLGEAHGWGVSTIRGVLDGLVKVLSGRAAGDKVPFSEIRDRPHRHVSRPRVVEVLRDLEMFHNDSTPAIRSWIDCVTSDLPPGFAGTARSWLLVLLDGDARARPRSEATLYAYFGSVRPTLHQWSARYGHLPELNESEPMPPFSRCAVTSATTPSKLCGRCSGSPRNADSSSPTRPSVSRHRTSTRR